MCSDVHKALILLIFHVQHIPVLLTTAAPHLQGILSLPPEPCRDTTLHLGEGAAFSEPVQSNPTTLVSSWKVTPRRSVFVSSFGCVTILQFSLPHSSQSSTPSGYVGSAHPNSLPSFFMLRKKLGFLHNSFTILPHDSPLNSPFKLLFFCAAKKLLGSAKCSGRVW